MGKPHPRDTYLMDHNHVNISHGPMPIEVSRMFTTPLPKPSIPAIVLSAPNGSDLAIGGIGSECLRRIFHRVEAERDSPRALFVRILPAQTTEAIVEQVIDQLSKTANGLWPLWFTDVNFGECRNDTLGRLAAATIVQDAAERIVGLSVSWAKAAVELALNKRSPRVKGSLPAIELAQLGLAVGRFGLVLVVDLEIACTASNSAAVVHALEWIAQHSQSSVVTLFPELPPNEPPFDRILYGARRVMTEDGSEPALTNSAKSNNMDELWLAPWLGSPHPLSDTEQRLAKALSADSELAPLFGFNQFIDTVRGSRPKVDLVWTQGRLVVELDGYGSHGNRTSFMYDRHRDYELTLSGYIVLRLANDEIAQDIEKAIAKIRDIVHLCRDQMK